MQTQVTCNPGSANNYLGTIAIVLSIAVGACTIYHMVQEHKYRKLKMKSEFPDA